MPAAKGRLKKQSPRKPGLHVAVYTQSRKASPVDETREIRRARIAFHNPAQFLRDASQVCREWKPLSIMVVAIARTRRNDVLIRYGFDKKTQTSDEVSVKVTPQEVVILVSYLLHVGEGLVFLNQAFPVLEGPAEDDGGEELVVPSATDSLADLPAFGGIQ